MLRAGSFPIAITKQRILSALLLFSLLLASCMPPDIPTVNDWCYTMHFDEDDYGITVINGNYVPGVGFTSNASNRLSIAYSHNQNVKPKGVIIYAGRAPGVSGATDITGTGLIFGIAATIDQLMPAESPDTVPVGFTPASPDDYSSSFNISVDSTQQLKIVSLEVRGDGANPFPDNDCAPDGTATPSPTLLPDTPLPSETPIPATSTPSDTPSASPTPSYTPTGPTPTPTPIFVTLDLDFRVDDYDFVNVAFNGYWHSGQGLHEGTTVTSDGSNNGYRMAMKIDLGRYIHVTDFDGTIFSYSGGAHTWRAYGYTNSTLTTGGVTLFNTTGGISGESTQTIGGNYSSPGYNGVYTRYLLIEAHSFTPNGGWAAIHIEGYEQPGGTPTPTPTQTATFTPSTTPSITPTNTRTLIPRTPTISPSGTRTPIVVNSPTPFPPVGTVPNSATPFPSGTPQPTNTLMALPTSISTPEGTPEPGGTPDPSLPFLGGILDGINQFFNWVINSAGNFSTWVGSIFGWLGNSINNVITQLGNFVDMIRSILDFILRLIQQIVEIIKLLVAIVIHLLELFIAWIGQFTQVASEIMAAWSLAQPRPIPALPQCITNPLQYSPCAFYYVLRYTVFAGTLGELIIPAITAIVDIAIILYFIRTVRNIIRSGEGVTSS